MNSKKIWILVLFVPSILFGAENTWIGNVSSDMGDAGNWSLGALSENDTLVFSPYYNLQVFAAQQIQCAELQMTSTEYPTEIKNGETPGTLILSGTRLNNEVIVITSKLKGTAATNTVETGIILSGGGEKRIKCDTGVLHIAGNISEDTPGTSVYYDRTSPSSVRYITGTNTYSGKTSLNSDTIIVRQIGNKGEPGNFGTGDTVAIGYKGSRYATLQYVGNGESTDRTFTIGGGTGSKSICTRGASGPLEINGSLVFEAYGTFGLYGDNPGTNYVNCPVYDFGNGEITSLSVNNTSTDTAVWALTSTNTYSGPTKVLGGELFFTGDSSSATGAVTVTSATLGGNGTLGGPTTINKDAFIKPGWPDGNFVLNSDLTMMDGSTLVLRTDACAEVRGTLDLRKGWKLALSGEYKNGGETTVFIFSNLADGSNLTPQIDFSGIGFQPSAEMALEIDGDSIVLIGVSPPAERQTVITIL